MSMLTRHVSLYLCVCLYVCVYRGASLCEYRSGTGPVMRRMECVGVGVCVAAYVRLKMSFLERCDYRLIFFLYESEGPSRRLLCWMCSKCVSSTHHLWVG